MNKKIKMNKINTSAVKPTEMSDLNDDCLIAIFQRLPTIADKIKIEGVCKRWRNLSSKHLWTSFTRLDMSFDTWGSIKRYPDRNSEGRIHSKKKIGIVDNIILSRVVRLCGQYLTNVTLPVEAFEKICPWTKNIRELSLSCGEKRKFCRQCETAWPVVAEHLLLHCESIRKIHFSFPFKKNVLEAMEKLLSQMKNLKSIYLSLKYETSGTSHCFKKLSFQTVEEIAMIGYPLLSVENGHLLSSKIRECSKLQKIILDGDVTTAVMENIFEALEFQAENLKFLHATELPCPSSRMLSNFSRFVNLEKLFIGVTNFENSSADTLLAAIVSTCTKLTHLAFLCCCSGVGFVTDDGISSLANLSKLKFLILYDWQIVSPALERMHNLEILHVCFCVDLAEHTLRDFLKKAHNLRVLILEYYDITETLLRVAIETQQIRKSDTALEIVLERNCKKFADLFADEHPDLLHLYYGRSDPRFSDSIYWVESGEKSIWKEKEVSYIEDKSL